MEPERSGLAAKLTQQHAVHIALATFGKKKKTKTKSKGKTSKEKPGDVVVSNGSLSESLAWLQQCVAKHTVISMARGPIIQALR